MARTIPCQHCGHRLAIPDDARTRFLYCENCANYTERYQSKLKKLVLRLGGRSHVSGPSPAQPPRHTRHGEEEAPLHLALPPGKLPEPRAPGEMPSRSDEPAWEGVTPPALAGQLAAPDNRPADIEQLRAALADAEADARALAERARSFEKLLDKEIDAHDLTRQKLLELRNELAQAENRISDLEAESRVDPADALTAMADDTPQARLDHAQAQAERWRNECDRLKEQVASLHNQISDQQDALQSAAHEALEMNKTRAQAEQRVEQIKAELDQREQQIATLKAEAEQAREALSQANARIISLQADLEAASQRADEAPSAEVEALAMAMDADLQPSDAREDMLDVATAADMAPQTVLIPAEPKADRNPHKPRHKASRHARSNTAINDSLPAHLRPRSTWRLPVTLLFIALTVIAVITYLANK